ncbi:MAG: hypothetical protein ACLR7U_02155 [Ruthenibacterium lactatiformans]
MTNIEVRTQNIYENLSNAEKKVASYFLDNVENVFAKPISQLASPASARSHGAFQSHRVRRMGLKNVFNELHETAGEPAEAATSPISGSHRHRPADPQRQNNPRRTRHHKAADPPVEAAAPS